MHPVRSEADFSFAVVAVVIWELFAFCHVSGDLFLDPEICSASDHNVIYGVALLREHISHPTG